MLCLVGREWGTLTMEEQTNLLSQANAWDTNGSEKEFETIIDLTAELSVAGTIIIGEEENEILIADDAIIYNPAN